MIVLSLFDGMSCGKLALERAGIPVEKYYASEIDKWAMKVSMNNYPEITQLGDINNWKEWGIDFSKIDLILAGFPCQAWSAAGNQKGLADPRGRLALVLWELFEHIKSENKNVHFLFENVASMKLEHRIFMDKLFGVESRNLDSARVSAQLRKRLYWANWEFPDPEDKGIVLQDILEEGFVDREKSYCIDANYSKKGNLRQYFEKARRQVVFTYPAQIVGRRLNKEGRREDHNKELPITQCLEVRGRNKSYCLTTVQKDTVVSSLPAGRYNGAYTNLKVGEDYRYLTPVECERLQTVSDNYTAGVSATQRYKMLGNGWTVDVIVHILSYLKGLPELTG